MNFIEKNANKKKIVQFSTVIVIVGVVIYLISKLAGTSLASLDFLYSDSASSSLLLMLGVIGILGIVMGIMTILNAIYSGYYFFKKNNKEYIVLAHFIVLVLMAVLFVLCIPCIFTIVSYIMSASNGNYGSYNSIASVYSSFISLVSYINYIGYLTIALILVVIFTWILVKDVIQITGLDFSLEEDSFDMGYDSHSNIDFEFDSEKAKGMAQDGMDKAKEGANSIVAFLQTQNGKIVLGVVAVVVVAFIGYNIYNSFFNYTTISLLSDDTVTISCDGNNGSGYINAYFDEYSVEYDYTDAQIASFLDDIALTYDSSGDLSNGDTVTISATYDKSVAKSLKLKIVDDTYTATVSGLTEIYTTADEVPSAIKAQVKTDVLNSSVDNFADSNYYSYTVTYDSMYYAYKEADGYYSEDYEALVVFKVDEVYTSVWNGEKTESTYYVYYTVNGVDSNYLTDGGSMYKYILRDSDYEYITSAANVESALKSQYSDYTLSKFSE
ncbi:MAG: hypothetical protein LUG46_06375 [Erysipelotrichaceae bacterium]|nr:hypothetical protein [Erysipelotrichaceae bacterium]